MIAKALRCGALSLVVLSMMPVRAEAASGQMLTLDNGQRRQTLQVEIARTAAQRSRGLMERDTLAENAGMLFVYADEQLATSAYWMYRTRIPLDIAFVDEHGVIRSLKTMSPCRATRSSQCPVYPAGAPFHAVLETNAGYFERHDVGVGDRIELSPWLEAP